MSLRTQLYNQQEQTDIGFIRRHLEQTILNVRILSTSNIELILLT